MIVEDTFAFDYSKWKVCPSVMEMLDVMPKTIKAKSERMTEYARYFLGIKRHDCNSKWCIYYDAEYNR